MAMKAVSSQGTADLEEELGSLRLKLEEERLLHLEELEKLRQELSIDTDSAAHAILNSKIQHLESQMENIQVTWNYYYSGCLYKNVHYARLYLKYY